MNDIPLQQNTLPPPPPPATKKKRSTIGFWIVIIVLVLGLGFSLILNLGLAAGLRARFASTGSELSARDEFPELEEIWSYGDGGAKVVRMALEGLIMRGENSGFFTPPEDKIESILAQIRTAQNDPDVRAIILEVDSPGGGITPSDEIYTALQRFKTTDDARKVVIYVRDLAASGGYYVSLAGDYIMAQPTSIIGSIGVIFQTFNIKTLSEKIGIHDVTIKSGKNKDFMNPFRDVDPAQKALLQDMIDAMYKRFSSLVQKNRSLSNTVMNKWADGRIFTSEEALKNGFIDGIGYWEDLLQATAEVLGEESVWLVRYEHKYNFFDTLMRSQIPNPFPQISGNHTPRFMYLWKP